MLRRGDILFGAEEKEEERLATATTTISKDGRACAAAIVGTAQVH